ncbi:TolC family protein [Helicobacter labetoulli]|uniref:TolC family protein n=1 Tax=Helicobacter labetoulli TaxID=2315333 RepID=UPI000EF6E4A7|nr:TolC family protein [Helicobacter labetoulli]
MTHFRAFSRILLICIFAGCSTKIPSLEESAEQTHIPQKFHNIASLAKDLSSQDSQIKQDTESTQNHTDDMPFSLKQFIALIDDKELHSLLHIALENNTNVLTMTSRIKQAKSQVKINTASMLPTINGSLNSSYIDRRTLSQTTAIRPGANSINASVGMSWELDLFGKLNALRQSSKKDYAIAQSNLAYAQISLIAEVANLYFTLRDNARALNLAKNTLKNLEEIESINTQKLHFGLIDIATYQSFVANTTTQKNSYETLLYTFEQNKNALLVLLNIELSELNKHIDFMESVYTFPQIATFHIDKMPSEILLSRPDIESSLYALHSQLYKQTNAKAARLPSISLSGSVGEILYSSAGAGSLVFQIANSITAPLLNRTSLKQNYLIQKELSKEAYYTLQNNINTALSEIENALFDIESKKRQTQNTQNAYEVGVKAYESNSAKNTRGVLDTNDFLTQENTYLSLQTQLFNAKTNEILSLITLFKALGGNLALESVAQQTSTQKVE